MGNPRKAGMRAVGLSKPAMTQERTPSTARRSPRRRDNFAIRDFQVEEFLFSPVNRKWQARSG
jgi:hypothetical protein